MSNQKKDLFLKTLDKLQGAEGKSIFGNVCAFYKNHLFAGVYRNQLILRLSDKDLQYCIDKEIGKKLNSLMGKPLTDCIAIDIENISDEEIKRYLNLSFLYIQDLIEKKVK